MSEPKVEYLEVRVDISSQFMDVFGEAVEKALIVSQAEIKTPQDQVIWSLITQAMERKDVARKYRDEVGSELVKVVYDVNYSGEGRAPEFVAYFRRPKTDTDREREKQEAQSALNLIRQAAARHGWSVNVFNTPEQYGRFGTVQHTAVSGPPKQTGTYLLWVDPNETGTENPGSFYYDASTNNWYDHAPNSTDADAIQISITPPKFTAYMGPIPNKVA